MLDDIVLFVHIVQQGGLSQAGEYLSLPAATVTRRLQRLESRLGQKLLHRSARQCTLTQQGEVYYQSYVSLVEQFEQTSHQLNQQKEQLSGKLKVLAPLNICHGFLKPMWLAFTKAYPDIQLELILSNQLEDIIKSQADLALRIGPQVDSLLQQKKIGQADSILVATPSYLANSPKLEEPSDLKQHRLIGTTLRNKWPLTDSKTRTSYTHMCRFSSIYNDTGFVKYQLCDHQGVGLLPRFEIINELKTGELVRVLPAWQSLPREIFAIWPSGRLLSKKAVCLRDYIHEFIQQQLLEG
ncbi:MULTISPECIES: LysR family transcriptional regulator [unclassified Pseudoalteromonas]|uniref:LysR family transcriptional regulator n=1 Tax=unclassified Pseudoalteromonas TaxID=194690 RepID=UPI000C08AAC0|nr:MULTISPECIES: LysR family transcriptional regulator [unclassified Pseudoalteromonas]MDP2633298.1 LysR family transcriptional regulator [Pseudoalteromonas sp. 1_MG-2023]PHN91730.1 LysR family transcriptional regulator [Pseudoalteromonas sp. 3D05]